MSERIRSMFELSDASKKVVKEKVSNLEKEGIKVSTTISGEMNFAGCAKGYCQAWD